MSTAFWDAAHQGDLSRMREFIEKDPAIVNRHPPTWKSAYQPTALAYAVWGNQPGAVRLLLESGANPNLADGVRERPLRSSVSSTPHASTHFPPKCRISLCRELHPASQDSNYHPLHWASYKSDHTECAQLLIDAGADVAVKTARGFTPLQLATGHNNLVSEKPGVAAVLEDASRRPRPPWHPAGGSGVPRAHSAPLPPAAPAPKSASTGELPSAHRSNRSARNSHDAWSPLGAAQEAAAAQEVVAAARTASWDFSDARRPRPATRPDTEMVSAHTHSAPQLPRAVSGTNSAPELPRLPRIPSGVATDDPAAALTTRAAWTPEALNAAAAQSGGPAASSSVTSPLLTCGGVVMSTAVAIGYYGYAAGSGLASSSADGAPPDEAAARSPDAMDGVSAAAASASAAGLDMDALAQSGLVFAAMLGLLGTAAYLVGSRRGAASGAGAPKPRTHRPPKDTPSQFICPITGECMRDPVTTADGHAFERKAIERWLLSSNISPMTALPLPHKQLAPAIALRQLIDMHMATTWNQTAK